MKSVTMLPRSELPLTSPDALFDGYCQPARAMLAVRKNIVITLAQDDDHAVERMKYDLISALGDGTRRSWSQACFATTMARLASPRRTAFRSRLTIASDGSQEASL